MLSLILAMTLTVTTTEAAANPTDTTATAEPQKAKPKLVCRTIADTGSRLPQRECRTQEDWNRQSDATIRRMSDAKE